MFSSWMLSLLAFTYLGCLFGIAFYGDRNPLYPNQRRLRPIIYSLALGVYCTSWTFFGAVGSAVRDGWSYLPIYLGPSLVFLFALPFMERLVAIGRAQKVSSIADFIASRFGKSRALAVLVTLIAFASAIPYIALQYKAVAASIDALTNVGAGHVPWYRDKALVVALMMALFAVLFGARRVDATRHREGLMLAIAFESLLKLLAFAAVGVFAWLHLEGRPWVLPAQLETAATLLNGDALMSTALAAAAIFCLPRQFLVGVIECARTSDLKVARWLLPAYLAVFSVVVLPVAALATTDGLTLHAASDSLILTLPMSYHAPWLTVLVFLGGLSAATAMVVVSSTALATMISNDIAAPLLWRQRLEDGASLGRRVLWVRRAVIVTLAVLAFAYYRSTSESISLAAIGLLAFAAVAQFAPGIFAALYWSGASRAGVFYGMLTGFIAWALLLFLPNLHAGLLAPGSFSSPFGLGWLWQGSVADYSRLDAVGPRALLALGANVLVMLLVSARRGVTLQERLAARAFVAPKRPAARLVGITSKIGDLETVAARIIGPAAARQALNEYAAQLGQSVPRPAEQADRGLLQHFERVLAGSIGASSARVVLTHALQRKGLAVDEVAELLDETSQELRFSRQLLQATMENVTQGISVVDSQLRIVAWNRRYLELFGYPEGMVSVGRPVAEIMRWNAERGELGDGNPEELVEKRLAHLRAGTAYDYQRVRRNGQVYSIHGQPMSGGGFVTTYTDITDFKRHEQALLEAKQGLEERVAHRTRELSASLEAQRMAKQEAEAANVSKTRFFAAASHDLLQPLNAARLFVSALESRVRDHPELQELTSRIDASMRAAEELLNDLLDIARLDSGALKPDITSFSVIDLLEELRRQYAPLAQRRNLRLSIVGCREVVRSDRLLLRRIIQNYLSNALRYTERGGVVVGCRRRGGDLEVAVYDTGPGIAQHQRQRMYAEFMRLDQDSPWGEKGLGLGLSICDRLARLMNHTLTFTSQPGRGSVFGVRVAHDGKARQRLRIEPPLPVLDPNGLRGLRVLCVDNDAAILDGMEALLGQWGVDVMKACGAAEAASMCERAQIDTILADYHLGNGIDGIALLQRLRELRAQPFTAALISADHGAELALAARAAGYPLLHKPLRPAALRALLSAFRRMRSAASAA
ncbi:MAG: PAS domain-containing hybrid sensor histidine kinase/response regulator [Steroidobacteraceae bacterium]|jgi:PAS domain S-box-containing protein